MLSFPPEFVPVPKREGYVWNTKDKCLYSYKSGFLKKLYRNMPSRWTQINEPYYRISHQGSRHTLRYSYLVNLMLRVNIGHTVPYHPDHQFDKE